MKKIVHFKSLLTIMMLFIGFSSFATTVEKTTFSEVSGTLDDVISYVTSQGGASTPPAIYYEEIRLYQKTSSSEYGGTITISAIDGYTLKSVEIGSSMATTIAYTVGTNTTLSTGEALASGATYTVSDINDTSITFYCLGSDKNSRLYVNHLNVTYEQTSTSSVANPTFSVEAGTYGTKQSIELTHENADAKIYYTLDGTTPDSTATLYEAAIELNTKTTVKAIAYVGEEASNVASATYDFHLDGSLTLVSNIVYSTTMAKFEWTSDWENNTVNYLVTLDGTEPTTDNKWNTGKAKTRNFPMYTWKKDSVVTVKIRPELDGIYGDVFTFTVFARYDAALDSYRAISTMEAGNYLIMTDSNLAHTFYDSKEYGYLPKVDVTTSSNTVSAFDMLEWTFEATDGGYYIKDSKGRYVYMKGTYNNFNVSTDLPTEGAVWSITINSDSTAQIMNVEKQKYIQYAPAYNTYGSYADASDDRVLPMLAVNATPQLVITPDLDGTTMESLSEITFYCADGIGLGTGSSTLRNSNYDYFTFTTETVDENTIKFVFDTPLTQSGSYTFSFVKNSLVLGPGSFDMAAPISNKSYKFTIDNPYEITVTPDGSTRPENLDNFTFTNSLGLSLNPNYAGEAPYLSYTGADGNVVKVELTTTATTDTTYSYAPASAITVEGTYTLVVGEGYFLVSDKELESPAFNIEYNLVFPVTLVSSTPAAGETISSLSEIIVEFNKNVYLDEDETFNLVAPDGTKTKLSFERIDATTVEVEGYWNPVVYTVSKKVRFYTTEPITTEGNYTFVLSQYGWEVQDVINTVYLPKTEIAFTIAATPVDYIFNANDHEVGDCTDLTDGIFTFLQGEGSTKLWTIDENSKTFSNGHEATKRIKPQTDKNYITAEIPEAGKLVFAVMSSSNSATDRTLSVKQNDVELYGKVVSEADKVDGVYNVHEVAVEAGTATISMSGSLNFYYIEFVPGGTIEVPALAIVSTTPAEGEEVESFSEMIIEFNKEIWIGNAMTGASAFVVKDAEGNTTTSCLYEILDPISTHPAGFGTVQTGTKVRVYADETVTAEGEYSLVIPANTVTTADDTEVFAETAIKFTVKPAQVGITATWSIEEGATIESFESVTITFAGEGIESAKAKSSYSNFIFYEKDTEGNYNLTEAGGASAGYMDTEATGTTVTFSIDLSNYSNGVDPLRRKGDYRIVLPVGSIKFNNDNANLSTEEYVLNFTIDNDYVEPTEIEAAYTVDPENNSTISEIKEIVVTFSEYETITVAEPDFVTGSNIPTASMYDDFFGTYSPAGYMMFRAGTAANQLVLYVDPNYAGGLESFTVVGQYQISVPAGVVKFGNDINAAITLNYTVGQEPLAIVSTTPAEGDEVESFSEMTVEYNAPVWNTGFGSAKLLDAEGTTVATLSIEMVDPVGEHTTWNGSTPLSNKVRLYTETAVTTDGAYSVVIAAETFALDDASQYTEKATINFTVKAAEVIVAPAVVATSPETTSEIKETFDNVLVTWNCDVDMTYEGVEAYVINEAGDRVSVARGSYVYEDGTCIDNQLDFVFDTPIDQVKGSYTLVIEAGYVYNMADPYMSYTNEEIRLTFSVDNGSGINGVVADPVNGYVVYDLNGYRVMQTKKAADLERLNNGIYIINGVKVLINK